MTTVCVIFGGANSEHEVSLRSSASVLENIDKSRYNVLTLGITKSGGWLYYTGPAGKIKDGSWEDSGETAPAIISPDRSHKGILLIDSGKTIPVDVVFPVLHGKNGEDGTVQGLLELAGIPYVGCKVLASACCMDKDVSHTLLVAAGVPKTKLIAVYPSMLEDFDGLEQGLSKELSYPMFVKPANAGSSVGVTKVKSSEGMRAALELAFSHDGKAVVEQEVKGQEIECSVMGNLEPVASSVIGEIAPSNEFYDYAGKYLNDSTALYIPARISGEAVEKIRGLAVKAYKALNCAGFARVDFFLRENGEPVLNEINTIPGFTSISMFPKLFEASGVTYPKLIDELISYALEGGSLKLHTDAR